MDHLALATENANGDAGDVQFAIVHALLAIAEQLREMNNRARQLYGIE
ncbi:hypothetical protein [Mycolicibacterium goodii]|nr:hypothetical protein [Mycolicibacterium goodii]MBU8834442.1 hypothetical protein [Mycolicibacterium goodii]